jgi:hypothetical protein
MPYIASSGEKINRFTNLRRAEIDEKSLPLKEEKGTMQI